MDIAIIGLAGRFPEASNISAFYRNLCAGKDSVREVSGTRRRQTTIPLEDSYQVAALLDEIDVFDHDFFNISAAEACTMDPHQRLLLEVVYETFENAGYNVDAFNGSRTALFVADRELQYYKHAETYEPTLYTGNLDPILAGRVSRFFNLRGNSLLINTACSSSLVAVHTACNELRLGDADYALACGVNLMLFPARRHEIYNIGIHAPDGKCKTFSADANGIGTGEAVGCVLLKPLAHALRDGDLVHAVIKASAVNQDANLSGSLTAPDSRAQAELIAHAWKKAKINPESVTFIEAHGTGTKLGDPIEVQGLNAAFAGATPRKNFCAVSSVKTNIGHTNSAAGIVGLIKTVLSLKHKTLFPSLHLGRPNPFIDFANSAVYVKTQLRPCEAGEAGVRRAWVSSFWLSVTNCHVVLEEHTPGREEEALGDGQPAGPATPCLVTISAKHPAALAANVAAVKEYVAGHPSVDLPDLSFTLNAGRKHYPYRFAARVGSREQLLDALSAALSPAAPTPGKAAGKYIFVFSDQSQVTGELAARF
ncbi:MAG: hypothetical protein ICV83_33060, partial [Cytophagales bacterium]|nr:hypothetical protein [Cytophagales bacterium]